MDRPSLSTEGSSPVPPQLADVMLDASQEELLTQLVEANDTVSLDAREPFRLVAPISGKDRIDHPRLPGGSIRTYRADWEELKTQGLVRARMRSDGQVGTLDVTAKGNKYCEFLKQRSGPAVQRIENSAIEYLHTTEFEARYPTVWAKWSRAEVLLQTAAIDHATEIGHLCREAFQEFVTVLVEEFRPPAASADKAKDQSRLRAVLQARASSLSERVSAVLEALSAFYVAVSDLVQRQEHGTNKTAALASEDSRRVVFLSALAIFEIDRALH